MILVFRSRTRTFYLWVISISRYLQYSFSSSLPPSLSCFQKQSSIRYLPWLFLRDAAVTSSQWFRITGRGSKQENNQEPILKFFIEKQASLSSPLTERTTPPTHLPEMSLPSSLSGCSKGNFQHLLTQAYFFLLKKKKSPSYKMTTEHTECRATRK